LFTENIRSNILAKMVVKHFFENISKKRFNNFFTPSPSSPKGGGSGATWDGGAMRGFGSRWQST
jgi:hypothetical protein